MKANSEDPDQTPHYAASDLGLHYLSMYHKRDSVLVAYVPQKGLMD